MPWPLLLVAGLLFVPVTLAGCKQRSNGAEQQARAESEYAARVCDPIMACHGEKGFEGDASGEVRVDVDARGNVTAVEFDGEAPEEIVDCIVDRIQGTRLEPHGDGPGRATCGYSGTIDGESRVLERKFRYEARASTH